PAPHPRPRGPFLPPPCPAPPSGTVPFSYSLLEPAKVTLAILDLGGRVVRRLAGPAAEGAGAYAWIWDGRDDRGRIQPTGVYRAVLSAGGRTLERRVALVR